MKSIEENALAWGLVAVLTVCLGAMSIRKGGEATTVGEANANTLRILDQTARDVHQLNVDWQQRFDRMVAEKDDRIAALEAALISHGITPPPE